MVNGYPVGRLHLEQMVRFERRGVRSGGATVDERAATDLMDLDLTLTYDGARTA